MFEINFVDDNAINVDIINDNTLFNNKALNGCSKQEVTTIGEKSVDLKRKGGDTISTKDNDENCH